MLWSIAACLAMVMTGCVALSNTLNPNSGATGAEERESGAEADAGADVGALVAAEALTKDMFMFESERTRLAVSKVV
jgi:hypothetical protein